MGRAPCCDKMGLNKGPWTPEEDRVLISYIEKNGHGNWRALPKLAGLSRCGKSCRLRWINYLRPDIKRGNFTREEEDTIIQLHEMLGNRWSTIASKLPGRTDNEIKNVWHTHLKKRLKQNRCDVPGFGSISSGKISPEPSYPSTVPGLESSTSVAMTPPGLESSTSVAMSPQRALSDVSSTTETSVTTGEVNNIDTKKEDIEYPLDSLPLIDESFWSDPFLLDDCSGVRSDLSTYFNDGQMHSMDSQMELSWNQNDSQVAGDGMDFWYDLFIGAGGAHELPEF